MLGDYGRPCVFNLDDINLFEPPQSLHVQDLFKILTYNLLFLLDISNHYFVNWTIAASVFNIMGKLEEIRKLIKLEFPS